jgi:hypothetical protein
MNNDRPRTPAPVPPETSKAAPQEFHQGKAHVPNAGEAERRATENAARDRGDPNIARDSSNPD